MRGAGAMLIALAGSAAQAQTADALALAECHLVLGLAAGDETSLRPEAEIVAFIALSERLVIDAILQAAAEGRPDPEGYVLDARDRMLPGWQARIGDAEDDIAACAALARTMEAQQ